MRRQSGRSFFRPLDNESLVEAEKFRNPPDRITDFRVYLRPRRSYKTVHEVKNESLKSDLAPQPSSFFNHQTSLRKSKNIRIM
jgi:hypothetical protein